MAMFLSLEINNSIKIIEASKKGITLSVLSCMTIDGSCVMDGRILDMDRTVNVINEALNNKGIKTGKAIFIINSSRIMIRRIKLPLLKKKQEILSMLQIELQQEVRTDLSKYMILYDVADITKDKKIAYAQYVAYCVPEELVNDCHELAVRLKLKSLKINIVPVCINELYKNKFMINGFALNKRGIVAFVNVDENSVSFSAVNNGICDFQIISEPMINFYEKETESLSFDRSFVISQIIKQIRHYYSVTGNRSIDNIYIYGINNEKVNEEINSILSIKSEVIGSISCLPEESSPDGFELRKFFNNIIVLFSENKDLAKNTNTKIKIKKGFAYAAIISIIAAASSLLLGFINTRVAVKDEMAKMTSYIDDAENYETYREIEDIKSESEYLKQYLSRVEELMLEIEQNDYIDTSIIREIHRLKPIETKIASIHSDKEGIQLLCLSPSMSEAALFFSDLRGFDRVGKAYMSSIQSKTGQSFSYSIVLKLKDVIDNEEEF